jgi:2-methylcitrate dehydratase PrpD
MEARFSLSYCAARILMEGRLSLQYFSMAAVEDAKVSGYLERIHVETIPDPYEMSLVTPIYSSIELKDGAILEIAVKDLKGSKTNPLSENDMENKFIDCLNFAGKKERAEDLYFVTSLLPTLKIFQN